MYCITPFNCLHTGHVRAELETGLEDYAGLLGGEGIIDGARLTALTRLLNQSQGRASCMKDVLNAVATCLSTYQYIAPTHPLTVALEVSFNLLLLLETPLTTVFESTPDLMMQALAHMHIEIKCWLVDDKLGHAGDLTDIQTLWSPAACEKHSIWLSAADIQLSALPTGRPRPTPSPTTTTESLELGRLRRQLAAIERGGPATGRRSSTNESILHPCHGEASSKATRRPYMVVYAAVLSRAPGWSISKLKDLLPGVTQGASLRGYPDYPLTDPGADGTTSPMCFSWNILGSCFERCTRSSDHQGRDHSPAEQEQALAFLELVVAASLN